MIPSTVFALILALTASPVLAGMMQVREPDEAATCELRGASMLTPAPENRAVFPQDGNCVSAEAESHESPLAVGASDVEIADRLPAANQ